MELSIMEWNAKVEWAKTHPQYRLSVSGRDVYSNGFCVGQLPAGLYKETCGLPGAEPVKGTYRVTLPNGSNVSFASNRQRVHSVIAARTVAGPQLLDWFVSSKHGTAEAAKKRVAHYNRLTGFGDVVWEYAILTVE